MLHTFERLKVAGEDRLGVVPADLERREAHLVRLLRDGLDALCDQCDVVSSRCGRPFSLQLQLQVRRNNRKVGKTRKDSICSKVSM